LTISRAQIATNTEDDFVIFGFVDGNLAGDDEKQDFDGAFRCVLGDHLDKLDSDDQFNHVLEEGLDVKCIDTMGDVPEMAV
jgi:hypothetical protein